MKFLLILFLLPLTAFARFESTTVVQVHPSMIAIDSGEVNTPSLGHNDYMENEFETVVAPETLRAAIILLQPKDAKKLPVTDEAIAILRKKINAKPRRGTDFIEIIATADSKEEATQLSEAVTQAYIKRRKEDEIAKAKRALAALDNELLAQSDLVQASRKELTVLIQKYGIPYFEAGNHPSQIGMTEEEMIKNAREKLARFEVMQDQVELQIKKLTTLTDDKLMIYVIGLDLPENQVARYYIQYQEARTETLSLYTQGLKPGDPKIKAAENRSKKLIANAQKEVTQIKENLKTKLELISRQVKRMREMVQERKGDTIDLSLKKKQYHEAKKAYEQTRDMLREMKIKQQEARVILKKPRSPVTIHERAK